MSKDVSRLARTPYSIAPLAGLLARLTRQRRAFSEVAVERWELSPAEHLERRPAVMLAGQLERIRRTEFASPQEVVAILRAVGNTFVPATTAMRFRDVEMHEGILHAGGAQLHLRRRGFRPIFRRPRIEVSGALYDSWLGGRWFGNWVMDDCLTYMLAATEGRPLTTALSPVGHVPRYEALLDMQPVRIASAWIRDLVLFDDVGNNSGKAARADRMRERLVAGRQVREVPGVFLWRGTQGTRRLLLNEDEIARRLEADRGFRVLDATRLDTDALIDACAGARVVAGVEGSQLVHGLAVIPKGAALLTLQPPDRVTAALKLMTDRRDQSFALAIGEGSANGFRIAWEDVARTLDLLA